MSASVTNNWYTELQKFPLPKPSVRQFRVFTSRSEVSVVDLSGPELLTMTLAVVTVMCFSGGYNVTFQLAFEVFPTVIRGRAVLLQRLMGDVGALLGAQVASLVSSIFHKQDG